MSDEEIQKIFANSEDDNLLFLMLLLFAGLQKNRDDESGDDEPKRYLNAGEQIEVTGSATLFGGIHGDKEYYKVKHHVYGLGYMLKKGFESSD